MRFLQLSIAMALCLPMTAATVPIAARPISNPQVDFAGFQKLTGEVAPYRAKRLVNYRDFAVIAKRPKAIILDARSRDAFERGHIQGAVNLPFTDFTAQSLAKVIGDPTRPILIYCNNNFRNNVPPVVLKRVEVALNIQTFINLVGYGYRNVYELNEVIDFNDPKVGWVSNIPRLPRKAAGGRPGK